MAKSKKKNSTTPALQTYFTISQRPGQILLFLLPLVLIYEFTLALSIGSGDPRDIKARTLLSVAFDLFGVTGAYLPGILLVVVLFTMHVISRDRLQWRPKTIAMMWLESLLLALPILGFAMLLGPRAPGAAAMVTDAVVPLANPFGDMPLIRNIVFGVGAGIYEELVFRLIGIALIHALLVDLLALPKHVGELAAIGITAVLFSLYHFSSSSPFQISLFIFYFIAGVYLAGLYVYRGFGIAAGTHAVYDILVFSLKAMAQN